MIFLSLGAGVQSSVLLMRAIHGDIDRPDHVLFADTGWEPNAIYQHLHWLRKQCMGAMIPLHIVTRADTRPDRNASIRDDMAISRTAESGEYQGRYATMPLFVDTGSGKAGRIRRQCSREYKIDPLRAKQRELLGYKPRQRIPPGSCATMIGISTDEAKRASPSRERWNDNLYPLIDPLKMSRVDCQAWWDAHYPHRPLEKSACIGCPFRSDREWRRMKETAPHEFEDACQFDEQIRNATGMRGTSYLHRSLKPLREVNLNESQGTFDLGDELYCAGGCGL